MSIEMSILPKISIVIPSFNQVKFLSRALDSLAQQNYPNLEVIVVDGASTDGTVDLLRSRPEIVTHWVSDPDRGQSQALNKGFALATGEIFSELDCDERSLPGALLMVGETFSKESDLDIVFGHRIVTDVTGREIERMRLPAIHPAKYALYASGLLFSDTTFWKRQLHRRTGKFDEVDYSHYGMDFDWFCRLGLNVRRWKRLDAYLSEFTEYAGRKSKNVPEMPDISRSIRRKAQRLAGISPLRVLFLSPLYLMLSRYGRFGWKGLLVAPSFKSILRVAGLIR